MIRHIVFFTVRDPGDLAREVGEQVARLNRELTIAREEAERLYERWMELEALANA